MQLIDTCLCGGTRWSRVFDANGFSFAECPCGLIHRDAELLPETYDTLYESGAYHAAADRHPGCIPYADRYGHDIAVAAVRLARYWRLAEPVMAMVRRALDVGAANGAFVDYLRASGIDAYGVDPCRAMATRRIHTGRAEDMVMAGRFDLVTYHDVLEHVLDPAKELRAAAALVRPGGLLVVDVPDVSVAEGEHHFKAEHLWFFTAEWLRNLLQPHFAPFATDRPIPGKLVVYACGLA